MANEQLAAFLEKVAPTQESAAQPAPEPEEISTGVSEPEPKATPDAAKPDDDSDDDGAPPAPKDGESVVPLHALEATRRARNDWKEKAARAEGELRALREQLEAAKAAPPPQPAPPQPAYQPPPPTPISFQEDPEGWAQQQRAEQIEMMRQFNANQSELRLRDKIGPEKLAELKAEFHAAAATDPTLYERVRHQLDPYSWVQSEMGRLRLLRDVGDDPAAYRAKIEAEARAKWEAEREAEREAEQAAQPVVSPAIGQPRSLATVRSVAARAAPAFTGDETLTQILAQRKF